jgi:hypothetical protein
MSAASANLHTFIMDVSSDESVAAGARFVHDHCGDKGKHARVCALST